MARLKHPAAALALITAAAITPILLLGQWGADKIAANQQAYQIQQMQAVLSAIRHDTALPPPPQTLTVSLPETQVRALYPIYHQQRLTALLVHLVAVKGYNGAIELLLAYRFEPAQTPALRVLAHGETAGIADFLNGARVKEAFDGVSGATISAAAVSSSVRAVQRWLAQCIQRTADGRQYRYAPHCAASEP